MNYNVKYTHIHTHTHIRVSNRSQLHLHFFFRSLSTALHLHIFFSFHIQKKIKQPVAFFSNCKEKKSKIAMAVQIEIEEIVEILPESKMEWKRKLLIFIAVIGCVAVVVALVLGLKMQNSIKSSPDRAPTVTNPTTSLPPPSPSPSSSSSSLPPMVHVSTTRRPKKTRTTVVVPPLPANGDRNSNPIPDKKN